MLNVDVYPPLISMLRNRQYSWVASAMTCVRPAPNVAGGVGFLVQDGIGHGTPLSQNRITVEVLVRDFAISLARTDVWVKLLLVQPEHH